MNIANKEVNVKLLLTEKEFIFSFIYLQWKGILIKAICICIMLVAYFFAAYEMSLFTNITLSIFLVFMFMLPLALLVIGNRAKKEYKSNYTFHKEVIMNFNDSGYTVIRDDNNRNHREWNYLHSVRETNQGFFLYYSLQTATYIPKRCFNSADSIVFFKELVLNHLDSGKVHLKNKL